MSKANRASSKGLKDAKRRNPKIKEPFAMVPLWMLDHPAFISLGFASKALLVEFLGSYNGVNNGTIWIAPQILKAKGFGRSTITRSIVELREHGFIYQTKRGGNVGGGCAFYALTWLKPNPAKGIFLGTFQPHAYENFTPSVEFLRRLKKRLSKPQFDTSEENDKKVMFTSDNQINDLGEFEKSS